MKRLFGFAIGIFVCVCAFGAEKWEPAKGPLMTRWAKDVQPDRAHREYPRPQLERKDWLNLNGLWDYAIISTNAAKPARFDGKILVPYPIESALSGVMKPVGRTNQLWYRRTFEVPAKWKGQRVILHFGAVDWQAKVWVNNREVGGHRGGYDGFSFDITSALKSKGAQELVVSVWDPTDAGTQPTGKQRQRPESIWYTSVTGIWQTPWLEPVDATSIESIHLVPDIDAGALKVTVKLRGDAKSATIQAVASNGSKGAGTSGQPFSVPVKNPKLWSPEAPFLYDLKLTVRSGSKTTDTVNTYFGMRKIAIAKDEKGALRIFLNNKPHFAYGPLDQGWWPDGLYTAPTDEALRYDIEMTKKFGMNLARKHVKVEPDRWYYWCDKLGLLVWQDMPNGDRHIGPNDADIKRTEASAKQFEQELQKMIDGRRNHPCIVMWVPFNEGWGQYDTARITEWMKAYDPSRLVNNPSGWSDRGVSDVNDIHVYPGPAAPKPEAKRALVLGEFGGLGLPMRGHTWQAERNWGYRSYTNETSLTDAYVTLIDKLHPLVGSPGLSAAIYTQTTDVEIEVNGLMTYDRAVVKMDLARMAAANRKLYTTPPPPPIVTTYLSTSQDKPAQWTYTFDKPDDGWEQPAFNAANWKQGLGGFGTRGTPGSIIGTTWNTSDIWLRREFALPANTKLQKPQLLIHHDEDVEIYINGKPATKLGGHTGEYTENALDQTAQGALVPGKNIIAVHCHQTSGGQYIDVGLIDTAKTK